MIGRSMIVRLVAGLVAIGLLSAATPGAPARGARHRPRVHGRTHAPAHSPYGKCQRALHASEVVHRRHRSHTQRSVALKVARAIVLFKNYTPSAKTFDSVCVLRTGRVSGLDDFGPTLSVEGRTSRFWVRNGFVAWTQTGFTEFDTHVTLQLVDVLKRRAFEFTPVGYVGNNAFQNNLHARVTSLVIGTRDQLAWIGHSYEINKTEVWTSSAQKRDPAAPLDQGADITPGSLRLSADGSTITWTRGGTVKSAPLG